MGEGSLIGFPARTTAVPVNNGRHCARPFWSTLPPGLAFPTQCPSLLPMHHKTSLLVSCAGEGGSLNVPVAVNCAWLVAAGGSSFTLCSCRPLPQLKAARERSERGPTESKRDPVTMHLRTKFDAGWDETVRAASCPRLCQFYVLGQSCGMFRVINGKAS